jgi:hypothetical protein
VAGLPFSSAPATSTGKLSRSGDQRDNPMASINRELGRDLTKNAKHAGSGGGAGGGAGAAVDVAAALSLQ